MIEPSGADTYPTAYALASAIKKIGNFDLILCGEESSDASTGQVPPGIAEWLAIPQVTYVTRLDITGNLSHATRTIEGGYEVLETSLPFLASVELGCNSPRFPDFRRKRWADKAFTLTVWTAADLEIDQEKIGMKGSQTIVERLEELPRPSRKGQRITGSPEEEAKQIVQNMKKALA